MPFRLFGEILAVQVPVSGQSARADSPGTPAPSPAVTSSGV